MASRPQTLEAPRPDQSRFDVEFRLRRFGGNLPTVFGLPRFSGRPETIGPRRNATGTIGLGLHPIEIMRPGSTLKTRNREDLFAAATTIYKNEVFRFKPGPSWCTVGV